jgi:hypothetical protein
MSGYVYCFSNDTMAGIYKIGLTTRTPLMRLKEANMGDTWSLISKFNIEFAKEVNDCRRIEKQLHKLLSLIGERVCENREFFKVSLEIIKGLFDLIDGRWYKGQLEEKTSNDINNSNVDIDSPTCCQEILPTKLSKIVDNKEDIVYCVEPNDNEKMVNNLDVNITNEDIITCGTCSKIYKNLKSYKQHFDLNRCQKVSIPRKIDSKCQYCEKDFATKQNKQRHEEKCSEHKNIIYKLTFDKIKELVGHEPNLRKR